MQSQDTTSFGMVGESSRASHELGSSPQITGEKDGGSNSSDIQKRVGRTKGKFSGAGMVEQLKKKCLHHNAWCPIVVSFLELQLTCITLLFLKMSIAGNNLFSMEFGELERKGGFPVDIKWAHKKRQQLEKDWLWTRNRGDVGAKKRMRLKIQKREKMVGKCSWEDTGIGAHGMKGSTHFDQEEGPSLSLGPVSAVGTTNLNPSPFPGLHIWHPIWAHHFSDFSVIICLSCPSLSKTILPCSTWHQLAKT